MNTVVCSEQRETLKGKAPPVWSRWHYLGEWGEITGLVWKWMRRVWNAAEWVSWYSSGLVAVWIKGSVASAGTASNQAVCGRLPLEPLAPHPQRTPEMVSRGGLILKAQFQNCAGPNVGAL